MIVFSDLHIHNYLQHNKGGQRLENCLSVLDRVFELAHTRGTHTIIFGGDLFDEKRKIDIVTFTKTKERFISLSARYPDITMYAITGNHDHATTNTREHTSKGAVREIACLNGVTCIKVVDNALETLEGVFFYFVPFYRSQEQFISALNLLTARRRPEKDNSYLVMHQTPQGVSNIHLQPDVDNQTLSCFKKVLCGHIHKRQFISPNLLLLGSPLHRDRGDIGDKKGVWDLDSKTGEMEFIPLGMPEFCYEGREQDYIVPRFEAPKEQEDLSLQTHGEEELTEEGKVVSFLRKHDYVEEDIESVMAVYTSQRCKT